MRDTTITRASRQGIKTARILRAATSLRKVNQFVFTPEEIAAALERARVERIEQDIAEYAHRKRES